MVIQALQAAKGKVQTFSDLPPEALPGTRIAIAGADGSARGQYYVKYVSVENGRGYWEETYKREGRVRQLSAHRCGPFDHAYQTRKER